MPSSFAPGQMVRVVSKEGAVPVRFQVRAAHGRELRLLVMTRPRDGHRWNMRLIPPGTVVKVEGKPYRKCGATGKTLRLRAEEE